VADEPKGLKSLATSWLSRTARQSGMAAGAAARLAAGQLGKLASGKGASLAVDPATQQAIAKRVAATLGEMKGLAMKAGQVASYLDFAMPQAAREALAGLQDSTPPMTPEVIDRVVTAELGKPPKELFAEWAERPFAAASIGQVHRARTRDGLDVAVKVQYPGIAQAIEADLKSAGALQALGSVVLRHQDHGAIYEELRERLLEECDYRVEARNQEEFRRLYADRADMVIPEVVPALSATRVLTTRFAPGKRFAEFAATASQEERDRAGEAIWDFAMVSIFRHGLFNADPHPGNYLFAPGQVVFLDFGCVKRYAPSFIAQWKRLCLACTFGDRATFDRCVVELGFAPDPAKYDFDYHYRMTRAIYEPWLKDEPYLFTEAFVARTWRTLVVDNPNKFRMNLPRDFLFVNRVQWGVYSVLATLRAVSNWRRRLLPVVEGAKAA